MPSIEGVIVVAETEVRDYFFIHVCRNFPNGDHAGMWTLDPIDGTKGFLRGEQYAVCLALIVDAEVKLGVMGCPNLPVDWSKPEGERGCLFVAVRGQGSQQVPTILNPTRHSLTIMFLLTAQAGRHIPNTSQSPRTIIIRA